MLRALAGVVQGRYLLDVSNAAISAMWDMSMVKKDLALRCIRWS